MELKKIHCLFFMKDFLLRYEPYRSISVLVLQGTSTDLARLSGPGEGCNDS
jgi:hypothetical protein